jgi:PAS domain S-box-containing protein
MKTTPSKTNPSLRQLAEEKARQDGLDSKPLSLDEAHKLLHELQVHQIELEMQNDELRLKQGELDAAYISAALASVVENSDNIIVCKDLELRVVATNMAFVQASGHTSIAEMVGKTDAEIFNVSLDSEPVRSYMEDERRAQLLPQGECILREEPVLLPNGEIQYVLTKKYPIYTADGRLIGTGNISTDITERKRTEEALAASELQYRTLADSGPALIWTARTDKLCDYFNKVWLDFTGRTFEQEFGNGWTEGVHPDDFQHCLVIFNTAFDKREKFSMHYRLRRHDGVYRWIQDDGCPRYDEKGNFIGYIGYCLDNTDLKNAENELQKLINNQESLIAAKTYLLTEAQRIAHIGSWELNIEKNELNWSDEIYRIFGVEPLVTVASYDTFLDCVHPEDRSLVDASFKQSFMEGTKYDIVHRIVRKFDHEVRYVHEQCNHMRNNEGGVVKSTGTVQDVTELVTKENDLKEYAHHIVKMIESERIRIARELHDELGQTLTLLSFAINQLKLDHLARKKVLQSLPDMQSGVDQMMESIRRICTALRPALLDELGLPAALEWLCNDFTRRTGLPCKTLVRGNCCSYNNMECCMTIFRIVQESLNNTMKHAGASRADISLRRSGGTVYVEINDDGRGMAANKYSADRSFGIIGMRERAHSLGATFEITSKKGKGTSVKLIIPCRAQEGTDAVSYC